MEIELIDRELIAFKKREIYLLVLKRLLSDNELSRSKLDSDEYEGFSA